MKNILIAFLICLATGAFSLADAQSVEKCFEADRRNDEFRQHDRHEIRMTINGNKVSGFYYINLPDEKAEILYFPFEGKRVGKALNVKFTEKTPNRLPAFGGFSWSPLRICPCR